jgi:hypothetical protein
MDPATEDAGAQGGAPVEVQGFGSGCLGARGEERTEEMMTLRQIESGGIGKNVPKVKWVMTRIGPSAGGLSADEFNPAG